MRLITSFILATLLFCSCKPSKDLVFYDLQNLEMKQGAPAGASLDVRMYNPNKYALKLKSADVSVFINGNEVGKMEVAGKHTAPALDTFMLPVTLAIDSKYTMLNLLQWVMAGDVHIKVSGSIRGGRRGMYIKVPVNYEGTQNLQKEMNKF